MKKITRLFYSLPVACALLAAAPANAQTTLFDANTNVGLWYSPKYHRIPAITKLSDGTLMAFADYRYGGDIGDGVISIVAKQSTDDGSTWGEEITVAAGNSSASDAFDYAHGDAAVVTDRESGKILMMCASGKVGYGNSTASAPIRIGRYYGSNDGKIWNGEDVTLSIYGIYNKSSVVVTKAFFGSGRICQSKTIKVDGYYRLYAALTTNVGSLVIYSDDFGESWKALGGTDARPCQSGDEAKVEELPNGNVLLSSKGGVNARYFNIFKYTDQSTAEGSWGTATVASDITTANCNGEILLVPAKNKSNGKSAYVALQSVPASSSRQNVSVYYKVLTSADDLDEVADFTSGWTKKQISTTTSGYSTMTLDANGDIAFLYEENVVKTVFSNADCGYDIQFQSMSLEDITTDYEYSADLTYKTFLGAADPWLGKVVTMKVGVTKDNTTTYYYIKDKYDETNCKPVMVVEAESELPSELDKSYYWVISKDPGADYYYFSSLNGDGYLGKGNATDYSQSTTTNNGLTCTDDKDNLYQILDFTKEATASTDEPSEMEGYAIKFAFTDKDGNSTFRLVALGVGDSGYELNWLDHTTKGTTDVASTGGKCWSTDFIFTEVPFAEPDANGNEVFVAGGGKPSHSGFPVKFTRSDDDYEAKTIGDVTEDYNRYATLKLPYAVELPAGVTAYKVKSLAAQDNTNVVLEEYLKSEEGNLAILPRETPVLLSMAGAKNDGKVQTTEYLHPALAHDIVETGFKGTLGKKKLSATPAENSIYILSKKNGRVAFYWLNNATLAANKAYYEATSTNGVIGFSFDGDGNTSSIMPVVNVNATTDANAAVYDLMGRRVNGTPQRGIYIKSGKKFIVR